MFFRVFLRNEMGNHIGLNNIDKKPTLDKLCMNPATGLIIWFHQDSEEWEAFALQSQTKRVFFLKDFPAIQEADLLALLTNKKPEIPSVFVPEPIPEPIPEPKKPDPVPEKREEKHHKPKKKH